MREREQGLRGKSSPSHPDLARCTEAVTGRPENEIQFSKVSALIGEMKNNFSLLSARRTKRRPLQRCLTVRPLWEFRELSV